MQKYADVVLDRKGNVVSGASVLVKTSAGADAQLYSDNGITPRSNPITTDSLGRFSFYAGNGRYNLQVYIGSVLFSVSNDILLEDPLDETPEVINGGTIKNAALEDVTIDGKAPAYKEVTDDHEIRLDALEEPGSLPSRVTALEQFETDLKDKTSPAKGIGPMGFKQSGSGSAERTAGEKLGEIISLKDKGAVGDGVADDTAALISAKAEAVPAITNGVYLLAEPAAKAIPLGGVTKGDGVYGAPFLDAGGALHNWERPARGIVGRGLANARYHFPNALASGVTSLSNSTSGSDSEGAYFQTSDNGLTCATNQITGLAADTAYLLRVRYTGNLQNRFSINWFQSGGTFISVSVVYAGSSADPVGFSDVTSSGVKEVILAVTSPALAARLNVDLANYAGRSYKLYGIEVVAVSAALRAPVTGVGAPFKGFSGFKVGGTFNWAPASLSFQTMLTELLWIRDTFKVNAIRMWFGLDGGMTKNGAGVFQSFTATALKNWDRFLIACEKAGLLVIPCLFNPIVSDYSHAINMDRRAMTDGAILAGYQQALAQIVARYSHMQHIVAWDVINEPFFMLKSDGTNTYTYMQISALISSLAQVVRQYSSRPVILSLADGQGSVYGLQTITETAYDVLDFHSYGQFVRYLTVRHATNKPLVMNEIGGANFSNLNQCLSEVRTILQTATGDAGAAWIWESFVRGGTPSDYMTERDSRLTAVIASM